MGVPPVFSRLGRPAFGSAPASPLLDAPFSDGGTGSRQENADSLERAYAHCKSVNQHFGKTYFFSTRFFPSDVRPHVHALYAWVRYPDEWVDNPGNLTLDAQAAKLREWRDATLDAIKCGHSDHPVLWAWADSARRYGVPVSYMRDFLDAMEMDLTVTRYQTFDDLQKYTWGSASVGWPDDVPFSRRKRPRRRPARNEFGACHADD